MKVIMKLKCLCVSCVIIKLMFLIRLNFIFKKVIKDLIRDEVIELEC